MLLVTDKPYTLKNKDASKAKLEVLVQATLNGGTATFSIRNQDSTALRIKVGVLLIILQSITPKQQN